MSGDPYDRERNDPANYTLGVFYCAPRDPRVLVPKRLGLGWTFNFAHPAAWLAIVALLAVAAIVGGIGALAGHAR